MPDSCVFSDSILRLLNYFYNDMDLSSRGPLFMSWSETDYATLPRSLTSLYTRLYKSLIMTSLQSFYFLTTS